MTTVDSAGPEWLGHVGVVPKLVRRAAFDAERAVALVCGPEVMMRFTLTALERRGVSADRVHRLRGAQHAVRHRALRALPARPDAGLPRRSRLPRGRRSPAGWRSGSCDGAREARRVEVLVVRRLPAQPARLRGRAAGARGRARDRVLPRGHQRDGRTARTTCRSSRARSRPPTTPSASRRCAGSRARSITIGACATAGGIQALRNFADVEEFTRAVYATPDYISTLRDLDADQRPRAGRLRAERLPDQQAASCSR